MNTDRAVNFRSWTPKPHDHPFSYPLLLIQAARLGRRGKLEMVSSSPRVSVNSIVELGYGVAEPVGGLHRFTFPSSTSSTCWPFSGPRPASSKESRHPSLRERTPCDSRETTRRYQELISRASNRLRDGDVLAEGKEQVGLGTKNTQFVLVKTSIRSGVHGLSQDGPKKVTDKDIQRIGRR